jgi:hypothetical protein
MDNGDAAAPATTPGLVQRLIGTIFEPTKMFTAMRDNPRWLLVFLLTLVIHVANTWIIQPIQANETADMMAESKLLQRLPEEQREQIIEQSRDSSTAAHIKAAAGGGVGVLVFLMVIAGVLWLGQKILGGQGGFKATLSAATHGAFIVLGLGALARLPLILKKQSVFEVSFSPAAFVDAPVTSSTYRLLANLDVFAIWAVIVMGLGLAALCRFGKGKGIGLSVVLWLLLAAVGYAMTSLFMGS